MKETCADCGKSGPEAESMRTMTEEGWRLSPRVDADGRTRYSWLCPQCWEKKHGTLPLKGKPRKKK